MKPERDRETENDNGKRDPDLDKRQPDPSHPEDAAENHHRHEGQRYEPQSAAAQLRRKQADGDHDQDVIDTAERVGETVREAGGAAHPGMRVRGSRARPSAAPRRARADET